MGYLDDLNATLSGGTSAQKAQTEKRAGDADAASRQIRSGSVRSETIELMNDDFAASRRMPSAPENAPAAAAEHTVSTEFDLSLFESKPRKPAAQASRPQRAETGGSGSGHTKKIELPRNSRVAVKTAQAAEKTLQIDMRREAKPRVSDETRKIELPNGSAAAKRPAGVWQRQTDTETVIRRDRPAQSAARRQNIGVVVTAIVLCFTVFCGVLTFALPKRSFSERENRMLAAAPDFSWASFMDGSFRQAAERWFADHFPGRDSWLSMHNLLHTVTGQRESGGAYLGKNGQLFLVPAAVDAENVQKLAEAISDFAAKHPQLKHTVAIVPNAVSVQKENLPSFVTAPDQQAEIADFGNRLKGVTNVDLFSPLREKHEKYIYYLTDHHWTSLGARYGFEALAQPLGITSTELFDIHAVSEDFKGTLASKSGRRSTVDSIYMYLPDTDVAYYVRYPESGETAGSMFVRSALAGNDKYAFFFGGNYPVVEIHTTADTGRRLLVFKDSYANTLMQFMYPYFDEIVMVDARYFYDNIDPILNQNGITDVLYLYNAETFFHDTSLAGVLQESRDMRPAGETQTAAPEEPTEPASEPESQTEEEEEEEVYTAEDGYAYVDSYDGFFDGFSDDADVEAVG